MAASDRIAGGVPGMSGLDESTVVYVPAFPDPRPGRRDVLLETRTLATGQTAALAFTSRGALVAAMGGSQPWIAVPLDELGRWLRGAFPIVIDATVPEEARRWTEAGLAELRDVLAPAESG